MHRNDTFSAYHPTVNLAFFTAVIGFTMFVQHPVCRLISFFGGIFYYVYLSGSDGKRFVLKFMLPAAAFTAVVNPLLSHQGQTILFYLPTGNPLTAESIVYGIFAAVMLGAVMMWFFCFSAVMTTDKFVYLFSRISPSLSLLLSMTLRFVPQFKRRFEEVSRLLLAQQGGADISVLKKLAIGTRCFVGVISWSLENAVETADSMKSRGYGTGKRTACMIYQFESRDKIALSFVLLSILYLVCVSVSGKISFRYYPSVKSSEFDAYTIITFIFFLALCIMPLFLEGKEKLEWKRLKSEI